MQRLTERATDAPVAVLAISVGEVELRVRRFFNENPVDYPVLLDVDMAVAKAWQVRNLPTTYVLDASLTPRLLVEHDVNWDKIEPARLEERLAAAIEDSGQSLQVEEME